MNPVISKYNVLIIAPKNWIGKRIKAALITSILLAGILLSAAVFVYPAFAADDDNDKVRTYTPATAEKTGPQQEKETKDKDKVTNKDDNKDKEKPTKDNTKKSEKDELKELKEKYRSGVPMTSEEADKLIKKHGYIEYYTQDATLAVIKNVNLIHKNSMKQIRNIVMTN